MSDKLDLYLKIAHDLKRLIVSGGYDEGEFLPSVRQMATQLGVNPNTVLKSYQHLEALGLIEILPKKGALIKQHVHMDVDLMLLDEPIQKLQSRYDLEDIMTYIKTIYEKGKNK